MDLGQSVRVHYFCGGGTLPSNHIPHSSALVKMRVPPRRQHQAIFVWEGLTPRGGDQWFPKEYYPGSIPGEYSPGNIPRKTFREYSPGDIPQGIFPREFPPRSITRGIFPENIPQGTFPGEYSGGVPAAQAARAWVPGRRGRTMRSSTESMSSERRLGLGLELGPGPKTWA